MPFDGFLPSAPIGDLSTPAGPVGGGAGTPPTIVATIVNCGVGASTSAGAAAAIGSGAGSVLTINCSVGTSISAGQPATLIAATAVYCGIGQSIGSGQTVDFTTPAPIIVRADLTFRGTTDLIPTADVGDTLVANAKFFDVETDIQSTPTGIVAFRLRTPSDVVLNLSPIKIRTGEYEVEIPVTESGTYRFTWSAQSISQEGEFVAVSSYSDAG